MKVLAIGATGFIGSHLVRFLIEQGNEVGVLHRGETVSSVPEGVHDIRGDRHRLGDSRIELDRFGPDVVVHLILYTDGQARAALNFWRRRTSRVVALSSADVYRNYGGFLGKPTAPPDPLPLSEDSPRRELRFLYRGQNMPFEDAEDYEKILVEETLRWQNELPVTVLRLPAVYGPGDKKHRLRSYLQRMADGRSPILLGEAQSRWRWTRGYVENVAAAVALAVVDSRSANRVYNVGDEPTLTEREWVERIGETVGWRGEVRAVPAADLPRELKQPFDYGYGLWTDTGAIRRDLGFVEPVEVFEALRRTVAWERSQLDLS